MTPKQVLLQWIEAFNAADAEKLGSLYHQDAINHQITQEPIVGGVAIKAMFEREFAQAEMVCQPENIFEDGEWAIMEWKDPLGLRGCGFFKYAKTKSFFSEVIGTNSPFCAYTACLLNKVYMDSNFSPNPP